ncbi:uncharacterized protein J4E79_007440 [Alternaria viburni]|uniref:uncharacterized protein n=1 Tax=Alternaria viburni TaxID=566460 RepID=UPI0020C36B35|nr:uncharacterized protein J4E79_007440 [Alternaria viburni]KAI4657367.1 hypothetical protein J4E79_007440 [Alternaria viburni]
MPRGDDSAKPNPASQSTSTPKPKKRKSKSDSHKSKAQSQTLPATTPKPSPSQQPTPSTTSRKSKPTPTLPNDSLFIQQHESPTPVDPEVAETRFNLEDLRAEEIDREALDLESDHGSDDDEAGPKKKKKRAYKHRDAEQEGYSTDARILSMRYGHRLLYLRTISPETCLKAIRHHFGGLDGIGLNHEILTYAKRRTKGLCSQWGFDTRKNMKGYVKKRIEQEPLLTDITDVVTLNKYFDKAYNVANFKSVFYFARTVDVSGSTREARRYCRTIFVNLASSTKMHLDYDAGLHTNRRYDDKGYVALWERLGKIKQFESEPALSEFLLVPVNEDSKKRSGSAAQLVPLPEDDDTFFIAPSSSKTKKTKKRKRQPEEKSTSTLLDPRLEAMGRDAQDTYRSQRAPGYENDDDQAAQAHKSIEKLFNLKRVGAAEDEDEDDETGSNGKAISISSRESSDSSDTDTGDDDEEKGDEEGGEAQPEQ